MDDQSVCFDKLMNNTDKFWYVIIGIALVFKCHFMHVLCSHMKNSSLSKGKGGTKRGSETGVQMKAMRISSKANDVSLEFDNGENDTRPSF